MRVIGKALTVIEGDAKRRNWFSRHPFITSTLALLAVFMGMVTAFPGDDPRGPVLAGLLILATPVVLFLLFVAFLIDRRKRRQEQALIPDTPWSLAPAPGAPASIYPPLAAPPNVYPPAPQRTAPAPLPPMPPAGVSSVPPSPSGAPPAPPDLAEPATHHQGSAFEETAHQPLPDAPGDLTDDYDQVTLGSLLAMSDTEFEQLCVRALLSLDYRDVRRSIEQETGPEVLATDPQGRSVAVFGKRYAPESAVGSSALQPLFKPAIGQLGTERGIFMTTSSFTPTAIDAAKRHEIVLIDGDDLVKILNLTGTR